MKTIAFILTVALLHNCAYQNPYATHTERDATTGALLGGAIGSMIGAQSDDRLAGAALGAGVGALIGGSAGQSKDRRQAQYDQAYGGPSPYRPRPNPYNSYNRQEPYPYGY